MSYYANKTDKEVKIVNDNSISFISLQNNIFLEKLVLINCFKLEKLVFDNNQSLVVVLINCPELLYIYTSNYNEVYSDSIYLGENCTNLKIVSLRCFNEMKIYNQVLANMKEMTLSDIKQIDCNFESFSNIDSLSIKYSDVKNITLNSTNLKSLKILKCKVETLNVKSDNLEVLELNKFTGKLIMDKPPVSLVKLMIFNIRDSDILDIEDEIILESKGKTKNYWSIQDNIDIL